MNRLKKIFSAVLGIPMDKIDNATSPENTPSWDSLNAIVLLTEIEKEFGVRFEFNEAMAVNNFQDVVNLVKSKTSDFHE